MKVFELHFNPRLKKDNVFDSFCYEPVNIDEKRKGNLYIVGELKNALPKNLKLIHNLASQIKNEYYRLSKKSPERSLADALKRANSYLENILKEGDTSWLGNLNFAILTLTPQRKNAFWQIHFAKTGSLKIFLSRNKQITDIGKNLAGTTDEHINPYPLVYFGNIASGKLFPDDLLLIFSKEVFIKMSEIFEVEKINSASTKGVNLLEQISQIEISKDFEKNLNNLLEKKREFLREISGVSLFILIEGNAQFSKRLPQILIFEKIKSKFSFSPQFKKIIQFLTKIFSNIISKGINKILALTKKYFKKNYPQNFQFLSKFSQKTTQKLSQNPILDLIFRKHLLLIILFVLILLLGLIIF